MSAQTAKQGAKKDPELSPEEAAAKMAALRRLGQAVERGDLEAARRALSEGADPNAKLYGDAEMPLLMRCVMDQRLEMARALLEAGADPNVLERQSAAGHYTRSALRLACENASDQGAKMVALLLAFGADPDGAKPAGRHEPASVYALTANRKRALREMVLAGYDFRAPVETPYGTRLGLSLLEMAEREKKFEMIDIMRGAEAELEGESIAKVMEPGKPADALSARRPRV